MIGDHYTLIAFIAQDSDDLSHINIALVDESFNIVWQFSVHIAEMDIADATEATDVIIDVATGYFLQRAQEELEPILWRVYDSHQPVALFRSVDQSGRSVQHLRQRVVRVSPKHNARLLRNRHDLLQKWTSRSHSSAELTDTVSAPAIPRR